MKDLPCGTSSDSGAVANLTLPVTKSYNYNEATIRAFAGGKGIRDVKYVNFPLQINGQMLPSLLQPGVEATKVQDQN